VTKRLALAIAHCEKRVEMHKGATHEVSRGSGRPPTGGYVASSHVGRRVLSLCVGLPTVVYARYGAQWEGGLQQRACGRACPAARCACTSAPSDQARRTCCRSVLIRSIFTRLCVPAVTASLIPMHRLQRPTVPTRCAQASDEVDAELERERQLLRALRQQCSQMCSSTHEHLATMRKATTDLEAELRDKVRTRARPQARRPGCELPAAIGAVPVRAQPRARANRAWAWAWASPFETLKNVFVQA
jgi:hypothetical protein